MSYTLYHYVHCPYCIRVRMTLGYLGVSYKSTVVPYDDEKTPVSLIGKKILPIIKYDGGVMNESLDIMQLIDKKNALQISEIRLTSKFMAVETLLNKLGNDIHSLAMPYWIYTPEFNESSREYFKKKKEEKRGPFSNLLKNQKSFIDSLNVEFKEFDKKLQPFYQSTSFGLLDIMIASHLWGLYVVPEFQFPQKVHEYLQSVKQLCQFNYHEDFREII